MKSLILLLLAQTAAGITAGMSTKVNRVSSVVDLNPAVRILLSAWYRADEGIVLSGNDVVAWLDQSKNGYHLSRGTGSPTFLPNAINGRPAVVIDGLTQNEYNFQSDAAIFPGLFDASGDGTVIMVVKTPVGHEGVAYRDLFYGTGNGSALFYSITTTVLTSTTHDGVGTRYTSKAVALDTWQILLFQRDADTTLYVGVDDLDTAALNSTALGGAGGNSAGSLRIGSISGASPTTVFGQIAEMLFFNISLTEAQRRKVTGYFEAKYLP